MQEFKQIKELPVNKTVVFCSPLEGSDVLVRTGTISENSFFLHAFLHGFSKDYINMKKDERIRFTRRLKASMSGKLDIDAWEENGDGIIAKIPFIEIFFELINNFIDFLYSYEDESIKIKGRCNRRIIKEEYSRPDI